MKSFAFWIGSIVVAGLQVAACGSAPAQVVCGHDCDGRPIYTDEVPGSTVSCSPLCRTSCAGAKPVCASSCGDGGAGVEPVCSGNRWTCPTTPVAAGMCPPVGCAAQPPTGGCGRTCEGDAIRLSCIDGRWECPPRTGSPCPPACTGTRNADCVSWCGGDYFVAETCQNGAWACPAGTKNKSECPASTCSGSSSPCYACQDHQVKVIGYTRCANGRYVCDRGSMTSSSVDCNSSNIAAG